MSRMVVRRCLKSPHEAVVNILLARDDVEVNAKNEDGGSPLSYVAQ